MSSAFISFLLSLMAFGGHCSTKPSLVVKNVLVDTGPIHQRYSSEDVCLVYADLTAVIRGRVLESDVIMEIVPNKPNLEEQFQPFQLKII